MATARCSLGNCYQSSQDPPRSVGGSWLTPESNLVMCSLPHTSNDSTSHNSASLLCLASKRQRLSHLLQAEGEQWLNPKTHFMHICPIGWQRETLKALNQASVHSPSFQKKMGAAGLEKPQLFPFPSTGSPAVGF